MTVCDKVLTYFFRSKRVACACEGAARVYGGATGTEFVDIARNPCSVQQITDIWVRHGTLVDAVQFRYFTPKDGFVTAPLRGGNGGGLTHIVVPPGAKVVGITGGIGELPDYGRLISQLRILVLDPVGRLEVYGPFGTDLYSFPESFAVYGNIKSIFGFHRQYLDGLGFNYEQWGGNCPSPCGIF